MFSKNVFESFQGLLTIIIPIVFITCVYDFDE